jgi:hypothetical protein
MYCLQFQDGTTLILSTDCGVAAVIASICLDAIMYLAIYLGMVEGRLSSTATALCEKHDR